jgi:hypothetical protein
LKKQYLLLFCDSGLAPESIVFKMLRYWMPDRVCPQLDWGFGMTIINMKQNITLSINKELIKKARVLAANRQTSISRMLSEELKKLIEDSKDYEMAKKQALDDISRGFHLGGEITVSREELHER